MKQEKCGTCGGTFPLAQTCVVFGVKKCEACAKGAVK